jgi:3',5'-cyclic-AMP phosphodiesterase
VAAGIRRRSDVASAIGVEVQRSVVDAADSPAARPPVDLTVDEAIAVHAGTELTTVSTVSATFHSGTAVNVVDGLEPATRYEHHGIAYSTLPRPSGALRCRFATVNDVHFGETEAGRVGSSDIGPIQTVAPGAPPYPQVMNDAALDELLAADRVDPFAALFAKGDLTAAGTDVEFAAFEACYGTPFDGRLFAVRGNHDCVSGQTAYSGDQWVDLDGIAVALLDSAVPGHSHGELTSEQLDWLDSRTADATAPVVVMAHHPQRLGPEWEDPGFTLTADSSAALDDVFARRPAIVAYTAGHTHRHRVQEAGGGVPSIEVGCVKDFPGTWAEYQVYEGGILQIVHRISSPEALAWSEQCRGLYADFGIHYTDYALGKLSDRCLPIPYR